MATTDKVTTTTTGTGTSATCQCPYIKPKAEQGWECPRCGRINAPWVRQCDCSRSDKWDITWNKDDCAKPWWYDYIVKCNEADNVLNNPNIYKVGGSDYKTENTYVNVNNTQSNKINPNSVTTAWNCTNPDQCHTPHYTTESVVTDGIHNFYSLKTPKETK